EDVGDGRLEVGRLLDKHDGLAYRVVEPGDFVGDLLVGAGEYASCHGLIIAVSVLGRTADHQARVDSTGIFLTSEVAIDRGSAWQRWSLHAGRVGRPSIPTPARPVWR